MGSLAGAASRAVCLLLAVVSVAPAQSASPGAWNDPHTTALVDRATARRTVQLADTGLADYHATAHGYLTFLAQVGEGFTDPPQVVRADELAVEVYWRAPNQSKQRIVGRRDTLLLPTDIAYHRDHLAIVQNNFPAVIRLGEGDEVRDVPHPLSAVGRALYDFAATDSLTIRVGARTWDVVRVDVRPKDASQARVAGSLFLDRETASVVRMSLSFTRAALLDPALEDVSIVLDNGLVEGRFWLPRRQEIEIRRTGTWLEFPARGIIRGEWDLCCVEANRGVPAEQFAGPEIVIAPPEVLKAYKFQGSISDSVRARQVAADEGGAAVDVRREAERLLGEAVLRRGRTAALAVASVSDIIRVNRVEGVSLGAGGRLFARGGVTLHGSARYGFDDARFKHDVDVTWTPLGRSLTLGVRAFDQLASVAALPEVSTLANSIEAEEVGVDATDDYRAAGLEYSVAIGSGIRWRGTLTDVHETPEVVHAVPSSGTYRPAFPAIASHRTTVRLEVNRARRSVIDGVEWEGKLGVTSSTVRMGGTIAEFGTVDGHLRAAREVGPGTFVAEGFAMSSIGDTPPPQEQAAIGGPTSAPGYDVHSMRGPAAAWARLEWEQPVSAIVMGLGRFGRVRMPIVLAPFVTGALAGTSRAAMVRRSAGVGLLLFNGLLRVDGARGLDAGGHWRAQVDFGRAFWPIL